MCKFSWISLYIDLHYWANLKPHFREHLMENVVGKHGTNETNQVLTICLLSTNVPQYETSISIIIYHSCLLIWCLKPERELASVQYLWIFILKTKSSTTKILAYLERAQKLIIWKNIQPSSSLLCWDMTVQTWWVVLFSHGPLFGH